MQFLCFLVIIWFIFYCFLSRICTYATFKVMLILTAPLEKRLWTVFIWRAVPSDCTVQLLSSCCENSLWENKHWQKSQMCAIIRGQFGIQYASHESVSHRFQQPLIQTYGLTRHSHTRRVSWGYTVASFVAALSFRPVFRGKNKIHPPHI